MGSSGGPRGGIASRHLTLDNGAVADLLESDWYPVVPDVSSRRRRRPPWVGAVLAGVLFVAALGVLVADLVRQHAHFDQAQAALSTTEQRTTLLSSRLDQLHHDLGLLTTEVGNESTALEQDTSQLKGTQWALGLTQASVAQQGTLISSLQTCLSGVEAALNSLAVGKQNQAGAELNAVASSCTAAVSHG